MKGSEVALIGAVVVVGIGGYVLYKYMKNPQVTPKPKPLTQGNPNINIPGLGTATQMQQGLETIPIVGNAAASLFTASYNAGVQTGNVVQSFANGAVGLVGKTYSDITSGVGADFKGIQQAVGGFYNWLTTPIGGT